MQSEFMHCMNQCQEKCTLLLSCWRLRLVWLGVKQGCPQTPTLFRVYLDDIYNYIEILGCSGACFVRVAISILPYANDIVVLSDSPEGLQRHLNALKSFCIDKDLAISLYKTEVITFNNTQALVMRSKPQLFLAD